MTPVTRADTTAVLGAPKGWDAARDGVCVGLPVTESGGVFYSYWRASLRERLLVLFGRPVRLAVAAAAHPPVNLDAAKD